MFNKQKFCHVASNNRNEQKIGVFVYKTTDNLATVTASGYFNDKIIDINLHDLIIHEKYDAVDRTKVERNILCVTERTLDNVGTTVIKSKWETETEATVEQLVEEASTYVKTDGSRIMTAPLRMIAGSMRGAIAPYWNGVGFFKVNTDESQSVTLVASIDDQTGFIPATNGTMKIGGSNRKWATIHTLALNNGYDIAVPVTNSADTLALKSQVDDAANSGEQLYTTGVWYAKMLSATTIPAEAEVEGRNYADFSQVDNNNDPIIVVYTYTSGAWVLTETITPPKNHNGYMTITSKIWDIPEQAGQQGGLVLWAHNQGTFTPYPRIVSFEDVNITGDSTVTMPVNPGNTQIVNKNYVDNAVAGSGSGKNVGEIFFTMRNDTLQGAVECNGGTYNTGDFSGAQSIGQLLEAGKVPYVSLAQYATDLATNGSVGVFGWDGAGTTTFKVPTLNDIFVETGTALQIGDYIAPGLPDHNHTVTAAYVSGTHHDGSNNASTPTNQTLTTSNASDSNAIYGNSNTVQPNTVRYRAMVQLAITATDEAVITCTNITSQVAANTTAINGADYVIESQMPTALNNYTWYRKYKSGWVEQGGRLPAESSATNVTVYLPIEMSDNNYFITKQRNFGTTTPGTGSANEQTDSVWNLTTTTFMVRVYANTNSSILWEVKGVSAN